MGTPRALECLCHQGSSGRCHNFRRSGLHTEVGPDVGERPVERDKGLALLSLRCVADGARGQTSNNYPGSQCRGLGNTQVSGALLGGPDIQTQWLI